MNKNQSPDFYYNLYFNFLIQKEDELLGLKNCLKESNQLENYFFVHLAYIKKRLVYISPFSDEYKELEQLVEVLDSKIHRLVMVFESAQYYFFNGKFKKAISLFYEIIKSVSKNRKGIDIFNFLYIVSICNLYSITSVFSNRATEGLVKELRKVGVDLGRFYFLCQFCIGDFYCKKGKYTRALIFLDKSLEYYLSISDNFNYFKILAVKYLCLEKILSQSEYYEMICSETRDMTKIPTDFLKFIFLFKKLEAAVEIDDIEMFYTDFENAFEYLKSVKGHNYFYHFNFLNKILADFYKSRDLKKACETLALVRLNKLDFYQKEFSKYNLLSTLSLFQQRGIQNQIELHKDKSAELRVRQCKSSLAIMKSNLYSHIILNIMNNFSSLINNKKVDTYVRYKESFSMYLNEIQHFKKLESLSLKKEIELIKHYVNIEQSRTDSEISVKVDFISLNVLDVPVPPLILQPLVENSIKHGFGDKKVPLVITIDFTVKKNYLYVFFSDSVMKEKRGIISFKKNSYGIPITNERLRLLDELKNNKVKPDDATLNYVSENVKFGRAGILLKIAI